MGEARKHRTAVKAAASLFIPVTATPFKISLPSLQSYMAERSILEELLSGAPWEEVLSDCRERIPGKRDKIAAYAAIVASGENLRMARDAVECRYFLSMPSEHTINREGQAKKKIIYMYPPSDEFLLKAVNRVAQPLASSGISQVCHSFQRGRGAKTAFRSILRDRGIDNKSCLRLDIRSYFNSIQVADFLGTLHPRIVRDRPLYSLIEQMLSGREVKRNGEVIKVERKGLMAGTPLAPMLSNLYLTALDEHFRKAGVTYARYSDDILLFDSQEMVVGHDAFIRNYLAKRDLAVNEEKSRIIEPGGSWEFLGFRYERGKVDISLNTLNKFKGKVRRLSRRYERLRRRKDLPSEEAVSYIIRRLNRKLYGIALDDNDLCWAQWFFPVLTTSRTLKLIDAFVQEKIRYAATGRNSKVNYRLMPYERLVELGYIPLTAAFHAFREDREEYFEFVRRRIPPAVD